MDIKAPFVFNYKKYETTAVTMQELDDLVLVLKSPATGNFQYIAKGIFLILMLAYIFIRKSLIEEKMHIAKQEYETGRTNSNADQIGNDDLD